MNRKLHLAWLLLGCIASAQVSAQSAAPAAPASGAKESRAQVKADTKAALANGTAVKSGEGGTLENAPPAKPRKAKKAKTSSMAASS